MHKRISPHGDYDHMGVITYVVTTQLLVLERIIDMDIPIKKC